MSPAAPCCPFSSLVLDYVHYLSFFLFVLMAHCAAQGCRVKVIVQAMMDATGWADKSRSGACAPKVKEEELPDLIQQCDDPTKGEWI